MTSKLSCRVSRGSIFGSAVVQGSIPPKPQNRSVRFHTGEEDA